MVKKSSQNKTLSFLSLENRFEEGKPIVSNFKLTCCSVEKTLLAVDQAVFLDSSNSNQIPN